MIVVYTSDDATAKHPHGIVASAGSVVFGLHVSMLRSGGARGSYRRNFCVFLTRYEIFWFSAPTHAADRVAGCLCVLNFEPICKLAYK